MEFLHWCKHERGHSIALWTAASEDHLQRCLQVFCPLITNHNNNDSDGDGTGSSCGRSGGITSCGPNCRKSIDFAWSRSKLKQQQTLFSTAGGAGDGRSDGCRWCKSYRNSCTRCRCHFYTYACPCMNVKDLKKVWKWSSSFSRDDGTSSSSVFTKERTIIIENTPQQCINNYGNAIYVPTFYGLQQDEPIENVLFQRMKQLILQLEKIPDVRLYPKCNIYIMGIITSTMMVTMGTGTAAAAAVGLMLVFIRIGCTMMITRTNMAVAS